MALERNTFGSVEQRMKPRIYTPFPASIEGKDVEGKAFKIKTVLDNISVSGLYFRLLPPIKQGTNLSIIVQLSGSMTEAKNAATLLIKGTVLRAEQKDGACGVAVGITSHHFVKAASAYR